MTGPLSGVTVAVIGAGTMGAGIAQVAAANGHPVLLHDTSPEVVAEALTHMRRRLEGSVARLSLIHI